MKHVSEIIIKQSHLILNNRTYALVYVAVFAILPFTTWLSIAIIALITLRKGKEAGFSVLLPAMVAYFIGLGLKLPFDIAIIDTIIIFVPVYLAACVLHATANWSLVFGVFVSQALLGFALLQYFVPDAVIHHYDLFQSWMANFPELKQFRDSLKAWNPLLLAHLFLGAQGLMVVISANVSLLLARLMQSRLFLPGGFKRELIEFRSRKIGFFVLLITLIAAYFEIPLAIDILPLLLFYFLMAGLVLSFILLARKKKLGAFLLVVSIVINPMVMFCICALLGILDSLFNFRMYLSTKGISRE